jgi:hypothetical protein
VARDDAAVVDVYLRSLAAAGEEGTPLPDPRAILRRARLRERLEAEQRRVDRAALPLLLAALIGPVAGLLVVALHPVGAGGAPLAVAAAVTALAGALTVRLALIED